MKKFWMIALTVTAISINIFGQKNDPASVWSITFGQTWGRIHENIIEQTVADSGQITYLDKRNGSPVSGQISQTDVDEIYGLLKRLKLSQARAIPSEEFNRCIVSMHLPNIYFELKQSGKTYNLSHCNDSDDKNRRYEYTLNLSASQKQIYKKLRAKLESLFGDEIKKPEEVKPFIENVLPSHINE